MAIYGLQQVTLRQGMILKSFGFDVKNSNQCDILGDYTYEKIGEKWISGYGQIDITSLVEPALLKGSLEWLSIPLPTIALVQKWLRVEKCIQLRVYQNYTVDNPLFKYDVIDFNTPQEERLISNKKFLHTSGDYHTFDTYEKAEISALNWIITFKLPNL